MDQDKHDLRRSAFLTGLAASGLVAGVVFQVLGMSPWLISIAYVVSYLTGGVPATLTALEHVRARRLDINLLMIVAALAAAGVGAVRDGAILLFLFSLASTLEGYAMGNTKRAVAALMKLRPDEANRLVSDGTTVRVAVEQLKIADRVIVRPGERIPIDGILESGAGAVDQSSVTGESVPVDKVPGDTVFAGTVNQNAVLTVVVKKVASESTLARMIELVTQAQAARSPSERFSDWFGQRYTIFVLIGSVVGLVGFIAIGFPLSLALYKAATLLVVASPCAIVISVPAAVLSALASAARGGVLFKGGAALEDFGNTTIIAFDKTGTLTEGKMHVTDVVSFTGSKTELLAIAAALEAQSDHPLARSVVAHVNTLAISAQTVTESISVPGKGIVATVAGLPHWAGNRRLLAEQQAILNTTVAAALLELEQAGKTTIIIGRGTEILGIIGIADTLRTSAPVVLAALRKHGVGRFVMLSGDTTTVAQAVGGELGIKSDSIYGGLLPEDKVKIIQNLRSQGIVAFIGDGVNDAAALATAHIGVAMGVAGTDVAIEAADVALLSDDLARLAATYTLAKQANRIIKQNLIFAVGIMALMVITTVFWYLPLPLGVLGHEGGTLLVVGNGLRLLFTQHR